MAFALGFVGAQDYSSLVVFHPPPPEKKEIYRGLTFLH